MKSHFDVPLRYSHRAGPTGLKRQRVHGSCLSGTTSRSSMLWANPPVTTHTHVVITHQASHFCMAHTPFTPRTATRQHHAHTVRLSSQTLSSTTRGQERTRLSSHQKAEPRIAVSHHQTHCGQLPIPHQRNPTVHADAGTYTSLAIESPSSIAGLIESPSSIAGLITCTCST